MRLGRGIGRGNRHGAEIAIPVAGVRFTGSEAAGHRDYAFQALRDVTHAAGIALRDVSAEENAAEIANLDFELVGLDELGQDPISRQVPCKTMLQRVRSGLRSSPQRVVLIGADAARQQGIEQPTKDQ